MSSTPQLSEMDFLRYIAGDLGLKLRNQPKSELLLELNHYLIERHRNGQTTVLVVDEAQHLSPAVLEEIRLLTNLETSQQKLLQILLVGQPELEEKLESYDLRQLKQRIGLRCRLEALSLEETRGYIARRLKQAGAGEPAEFIFPPAASAVVHRCSSGHSTPDQYDLRERSDHRLCPPLAGGHARDGGRSRPGIPPGSSASQPRRPMLRPLRQ